MAIKRFVRSTALLGASGALIALAPLAQAGPASAATSQYAFGANAFGTQVSASLVGGDVTSGRSANVTLGCTTRSQQVKNSTAAAHLTAISSTVGAVSTKLTTSRNPTTGVYSDTADSTVGAVNLLGGAVTADAVKADASASEGGSSPAASASVTLTNLKVGGATVTNPKANDKITVTGVGTVVINSQKIIKTSGRALANVDAIVITLSTTNTLGLPAGATITVGHAMATVGGPVSGLLSGSSFGSSITGGPVTSGPSFRAYVTCTGTGGATVTRTGTLGTIGSSPVSAGLVTDTAKGTDNATTLSADTTSDVANLRVANTGQLADLVSVDAIHVAAHADVTNGTLNDSGSTTVGTLKLLGVTVTLPQPIPANYQVDLTGLTGLTGATLTLNKQIVGKSGLQVEGLVLTLPAVGTIVIASASAYA
jgi:hypothetical protein